jgi:hypothetical protein
LASKAGQSTRSIISYCLTIDQNLRGLLLMIYSPYSTRKAGEIVIHIIRTRATQQQMSEMLEVLGTYVKLAVDVQRHILAGGGAMHADCEAALLEDGSQQADVWGADWNPTTQQVTFESLINIRPRQNNPALEILDPEIQQQVARITRDLLEGA